MPTVTLLWAGVLGIMSIAVAFPVGSLRGKLGVSIGDGGDQNLLLALRRHGNFTEFVPLALILMGLLEMNGLSAMTMHIFGAILVVARICHAIGLESRHGRNTTTRCWCRWHRLVNHSDVHLGHSIVYLGHLCQSQNLTLKVTSRTSL